MKCAHSSCRCNVGEATSSEERFCGEECRESAPAVTACPCGHVDCSTGGGSEVM
jgi:hypothetical protein